MLACVFYGYADDLVKALYSKHETRRPIGEAAVVADDFEVDF